ncbi:DUF5412 family protein [Alteromonas oceanisediminis]|uniref:DUF5412 family protein n=1 Tax=Alteromonas oceanisediminis TaxID=2836180 RepID=UPI001BDA5719|nr:DUF5412 family protein [Alteromonas oceanisediminis]MBT0587808.1 hypothetical protein [Alteromonas oceanisediminis]
MKTWKKVVLCAGSVIVGIPIAMVGLFVYVTSDMCGNDIYSETVSPNGDLKVVVFQRDCGAMTGFSTQVSIIDADDTLENEAGNIYIIDGHPEISELIINWASDNEVMIEKGIASRESKAESSWGFFDKIEIRYSKSTK